CRRQRQPFVPLRAAGADRGGILLDPLAQAVGEIGTGEQAITQRQGAVEVSGLCPATGGAEAMRCCTAIGCVGTLPADHVRRSIWRVSPASLTSRNRTVRVASVAPASARSRSTANGTNAIAPIGWS